MTGHNRKGLDQIGQGGVREKILDHHEIKGIAAQRAGAQPLKVDKRHWRIIAVFVRYAICQMPYPGNSPLAAAAALR